VYWEKAPDRRTSRTPDWLNDACEAKLKKKDRDQGAIKYAALMSPISVGFISRGTSLSFDRKHLFTQANRAKLRLGKGRYTRKSPISLLLTAEPTTVDDDRNPQQIQPYVLLATKKRIGRRAAVSKYQRAEVSCQGVEQVTGVPRDPARQAVNHFQCTLHTGTVDLNVRFASRSEANALYEFLKLDKESQQATAKSSP